MSSGSITAPDPLCLFAALESMASRASVAVDTSS
jgi:hypothetical protein